MPAVINTAGFFMRGLHGITKKQQPQKLAQGGMVRGPGTGTSDSIQAEVPAGSYIMPADSTQKLGVGGLKGLGQSVPVNLSNGEYQLPPEQVHAVGVQALDQMKAATHTPVSPDQVQGQQGLGLKPELFFANGGVVPDFYVADDGTVRSKDEYKARSDTATRAKADSAAWKAEQSATASQYRPASGEPPVPKPAVAPVEPPKKAGGLGGRGRAALAGLSGVSEGVTAYENTAKVAADPRATGLDMAAEAGRGVSRTAGAIAGSLGGARLGSVAGPVGAAVGGIAGGALGAWAPDFVINGARELGAPKPNITADTAKAYPHESVKQSAVSSSKKSEPVQPAQPVTLPTVSAPATQANNNQSEWTNTGIGSGKSQVVGRVGKDGVPEFTNDPAAINGAAAMPNNGVGGVGGLRSGRTFTQMQSGDSQEALDRFDRANQIYREMDQMRRGNELGDNGNQLTVVRDSSRAPSYADMLNARIDSVQSRDALARQDYGLRRQQLNSEQQAAAIGLGLKSRELEMAESAAQLGNQRTQQEIDAGRLALMQQRQIQDLRDRILSSTDQRERSALTEQLSALLGRDATPNRFTVVPGGQEFDPASSMVVNRPARVINNQTGQWVDQQGTPANAGMTLVGHSNGKPVYKDANGKTYIDN